MNTFIALKMVQTLHDLEVWKRPLVVILQT